MSLEGWVPDVGPYLTLEEVVEFAFDYRGNTTIVKRDGTEIVAYIFNRNTYAPEPFIEYFDESGEGPFTLRYTELANIKFTGKDTAAGNSWKAWLERKEREKERSAEQRTQQTAASPSQLAEVRAAEARAIEQRQAELQQRASDVAAQRSAVDATRRRT